MLQARVKILYNRYVQEGYFHLGLEAGQIARKALPGQFLNIRINNTFDPLLRRPLSIHRVNKGHIEILYEVVGGGTELLSRKKPGEYLDVIGPLGNGFNYKSHDPRYCVGAPSHKSQVLVAGGMGVAPLVFLAEKLSKVTSPRHKNWRVRQELWRNKSQGKTLVLLGAKTESKILCEKEFKKLGCDVKIATDDGSRDFKGKVSDLLKHLLLTVDCWTLWTIYACGPEPMLIEISKISAAHKIPAQLSLEEHMACGMGACFGCAVRTKTGYKRACKDGPVFEASQVIWRKERV